MSETFKRIKKALETDNDLSETTRKVCYALFADDSWEKRYEACRDQVNEMQQLRDEISVLKKQTLDERMRNRQELKRFLSETKATVEAAVRDWVMAEIELCTDEGGFAEIVHNRFLETFNEWTESRKIKNRIKRLFQRG